MIQNSFSLEELIETQDADTQHINPSPGSQEAFYHKYIVKLETGPLP